MKKINFIVFLLLFLGLFIARLYSADSLDSLKSEIQLFESIERLNAQLTDRSQINLQIDKNLEIASKIIDWSAMFFGAITLLLIIAGAIGLKEFSNIRKVEKDLLMVYEKMEKEFEHIQNLKSETQEKIEELKQKISNESKEFLNLVYLLNQGIRSYDSGDLSTSIKIFKKILRKNPHDYAATCYLARAYLGQEEYAPSIETAELAVPLSDEPFEAYSILGEAYRTTNQFEKSINAFKKSLDINMKPWTLNNLAYSYYRSHNNKLALETFKKSLDLDRNSTATCGLAKSLYKLKEHDKAIEYFNETITLAKERIEKGSENIFMYYNLAYAYFMINNFEKCLKALEYALNKNMNTTLIKQQLVDFEIMDNETVNQDLLEKCILLMKNKIERKVEAFF